MSVGTGFDQISVNNIPNLGLRITFTLAQVSGASFDAERYYNRLFVELHLPQLSFVFTAFYFQVAVMVQGFVAPIM